MDSVPVAGTYETGLAVRRFDNRFRAPGLPNGLRRLTVPTGIATRQPARVGLLSEAPDPGAAIHAEETDVCFVQERPPAMKMSPERGSVSVLREANSYIVRARGEHDLSTAAHFGAAFVEVALIDGADVTVDLSDVTFMDCSTVRVLVRGHGLLASRDRSLSVRCATARQRWFLHLCGLTDLVADRAPTPLESWVDVPATVRAVEGPTPPVEHSPGVPRSASNVSAVE